MSWVNVFVFRTPCTGGWPLVFDASKGCGLGSVADLPFDWHGVWVGTGKMRHLNDAELDVAE